MTGRANILDDQAIFVFTLETALRYVRLAIHRPSRRTGAASIEDSEVIEKILKHLGCSATPRRALRREPASARAAARVNANGSAALSGAPCGAHRGPGHGRDNRAGPPASKIWVPVRRTARLQEASPSGRGRPAGQSDSYHAARGSRRLHSRLNLRSRISVGLGHLRTAGYNQGCKARRRQNVYKEIMGL